MSILEINIQMFAGNTDKTEKATPKKRRDARKKGQVLQSKEISSAIVLILVFISLKISGKYIYEEISVFARKMIVDYPYMEELFTLNGLMKLFADTVIVLIKATAPTLTVAVIAGFLAGYAQVGFIFTTDTLTMKFDRINPVNGFKRLFSLQGISELIKSVLKIAIIFYMTYTFLDSRKYSIINLMDTDVKAAAVFIGITIIDLAVRICIVLVVLGIFDFIYQWWEYEKSLKMTKQEVKEEYKQTEGNPEIKSRIKQKQRQVSMRRMLHDVPKADVVITNPTHYAVALEYDGNISEAPVVIAKGQDFIALRIKDKARESNVEIVENKELARTLYESVDVGEPIPTELYQAVAEILAFVYNLKGNRT